MKLIFIKLFIASFKILYNFKVGKMPMSASRAAHPLANGKSQRSLLNHPPRNHGATPESALHRRPQHQRRPPKMYRSANCRARPHGFLGWRKCRAFTSRRLSWPLTLGWPGPSREAWWSSLPLQRLVDYFRFFD